MQIHMIDKLKPFKQVLIFGLIITSFLVYMAGKDAIQSTKLYNDLDLKSELRFVIIEKYNKKKDGEPFPDFNYKGRLISTNEIFYVSVSGGDYENAKTGDTISVFKSKNTNKLMTKYEIKNQMIIHIGDKGYSFVFIPMIVVFSIFLICLISLIKIQLKKE